MKKPAPDNREKMKAVDWPGNEKEAEREREKEEQRERNREREAIQSTISFPHCLPARIWICTLKEDKKNALASRFVGLLSPLFYLQLNAFQMEQLYRKHFW